MVPEDGLPEEDDQFGSDDPSEGSGSDKEQPELHSQAPKPTGRRNNKRGGKRDCRRGRGAEFHFS